MRCLLCHLPLPLLTVTMYGLYLLQVYGDEMNGVVAPLFHPR